MIGDFNYAAHRCDSFNKDDSFQQRAQGPSDEDHFCKLLRDPFGFCELAQEEYTHDSAIGRSRLDRVYSNHHLTDQLDRCMGCAALTWVPGLSAHRPVAFFRRGRSKDNSDRIPDAPMRNPQWAQRVALRYGELRRSDSHDDQPLRRLLLAKQAIREVSRAMNSQEKLKSREGCR